MATEQFIVNGDGTKKFLVNANPTVMLKEMEAAGVKMGRTSLGELLKGQREEVMGFKLVNAEVDLTDNSGGGETTNQDNGGQQASGGDTSNNAGSDTSTSTTTTTTSTDGGNTDTKTADAKTEKPAPAKKTIRAHEPKGKIKAVRGGTKIAKGLELLFKGANLADLEAAELSDDLPDFVNRRVTKRGYGITISGEGADAVYKLKMPNGADKIAYSAGAPEEDKGDNVKADASAATVDAAESGKPVAKEETVGETSETKAE